MITFFGEPTSRPPKAAPPIVTNSDGWISAPTWPPDIAKPPRTEPTTIMMPTMTSMSLLIRNDVNQKLQFARRSESGIDAPRAVRLTGTYVPRLGNHSIGNVQDIGG